MEWSAHPLEVYSAPDPPPACQSNGIEELTKLMCPDELKSLLEELEFCKRDRAAKEDADKAEK